MIDEEQMRIELRRMQKRADEITDESLESTRRILQTAEETQESGIKTLVKLDEQGKKLNNVEGDLEEINAGVREAEEDLTQMDKFCGLCSCSCRRRRKTEQYKNAFGKIHQKKNDVKKEHAKKAQNSSGNFIKRVTNDAREDEMEDNITQVASIVDNLEMMAIDISLELDKQNAQISRITEQTVANADQIGEANKQVEKLLAG